MTTQPTRAPLPWLRAGDVLMAVVLLVMVQIDIWVFEAPSLALDQQVAATVLAPVVTAPLAFRRVGPMRAFAVNALATGAMVTIGFASDFYQWANLILLFTVSAYYRGLKSWLVLAAGLAGVGYYFQALPDEGWDTGFVILAVWLVGWLAGRVYGSRIEEDRLRADRDLAAEVAATRQERLELEAQRTRMARELHDLIGHTVNVMVVHAGAGRRAVRTDPEGAERAFATIESTGRSALEELDRVLGLLRHDGPDAPLAPLPGLESLADLVEEFRGAGLAVALEVSGSADSVPAGLGLTIYRIVQESLTNTLKHAGAGAARAVVSIDAESVEVEVTDDGRGPADNGDGSGRGLVGVAERVQLHGGRATFGPIDGPASGFRVRCLLPLHPADRADSSV